MNLAEKISNYFNFGILLLEDRDGSRTTAIVQQYQLKAEDINRHIFTLWLQGSGQQPVSWATLVSVLQKMGLNAIAEDIKRVKCCL